MAKTKSQLATAVLQQLSVLAAEEAASADDSNTVQTIYEDRLERLYDDELAYWLADEIPEAVFRAVVILIANEAAPTFGQIFDPSAELYAEGLLKKHNTKQSTGEPIEAVYY